jgi:hypothetical protein
MGQAARSAAAWIMRAMTPEQAPRPTFDIRAHRLKRRDVAVEGTQRDTELLG